MLAKIAERMPITLALNIVELLIIVMVAVPIGVLSATPAVLGVRQDHHRLRLRRIRHARTSGSPSCSCSLFGAQLGWLPISGLRHINWEYLSVLAAAVGTC